MAKQKTKEIPFGNRATETSPGMWEWDLGRQTWRWGGGGRINFGLVTEEEWEPSMFLPTLKDAAYFSEGFFAGERWALRPQSPHKPAPEPALSDEKTLAEQGVSVLEEGKIVPKEDKG